MIVYSSDRRFMAPQSPERGPAARPTARRLPSSAQSGRDEGDSALLKPPKRAQTYPHGSPVDAKGDKSDGADAFENNEDSDPEPGLEITRASIELDVLPIELVTLTDRYY
jgi:hypothetical protein